MIALLVPRATSSDYTLLKRMPSTDTAGIAPRLAASARDSEKPFFLGRGISVTRRNITTHFRRFPAMALGIVNLLTCSRGKNTHKSWDGTDRVARAHDPRRYVAHRHEFCAVKSLLTAEPNGQRRVAGLAVRDIEHLLVGAHVESVHPALDFAIQDQAQLGVLRRFPDDVLLRFRRAGLTISSRDGQTVVPP